MVDRTPELGSDSMKAIKQLIAYIRVGQYLKFVSFRAFKLILKTTRWRNDRLSTMEAKIKFRKQVFSLLVDLASQINCLVFDLVTV